MGYCGEEERRLDMMISAYNLMWIVPLAASFGIMLIALVTAGRDDK